MRATSFAGCSAAYLSQIENGRRTPSLQVLVELGRRLGVDAQYLAKGETAAAVAREPSSLEMYRRALSIARTRDEHVWVLAGLAQAAALSGDTALVRGSLRRALILMEAA